MNLNIAMALVFLSVVLLTSCGMKKLEPAPAPAEETKPERAPELAPADMGAPDAPKAAKEKPAQPAKPEKAPDAK